MILRPHIQSVAPLTRQQDYSFPLLCRHHVVTTGYNQYFQMFWQGLDLTSTGDLVLSERGHLTLL